MTKMYPDTLKLFYQESKDAHAALTDVLKQYRSNTTTVLALATGAATFFGFANSPKGLFYALALIAYGIAVFLAVAIFWPVGWRTNVGQSFPEVLKTPPEYSPAKATYDLGYRYQQAWEENLDLLAGRWGVATRFAALLVATSLVVVFAGINTLTAGSPPAQVTKVQIVSQ